MEDLQLKRQALKDLTDRKRQERLGSRFSAKDSSVNLAKGDLDKDVFKVSGGSMNPDVSEPKTRMNVGTDRIDTKGIQKLTNADDFAKRNAARSLQGDIASTMADAVKRGDNEMINKLKMISKKMGSGLKAIPVVGAAAALMGSEDASAAIPGLDTADSAGMSADAENQMLAEYDARKNYNNSQASMDRMEALKKLRNK